MKKIKVLIIANNTTYTYNLRNEIIERLVANDCEVVIVADILLFQKELQDLGARLVNVKTNRHGTNPFSDIKLMLQYKKILREEKPDVVLSYNIKPNIYGGIACQLTHTHYIPNITGLGTPVEHKGLMQVLTTRLYRIGVAKADCIMFQNEENRSFFLNRHMITQKARTKLLPGSGVSLKLHKRIEYPSDDKTVHFLFIARLLQEKGIDLYLNAARRIYANHPNTVFHICGLCDDPKYLKLLQTKELENYIMYHGEQKDLLPYFQLAHCIVHPSYYPEGMSNVLLEAAAHCRPIIATNRAGCRETVEDRKTGYLIPIKDEDALVNALESFLALSLEQKREMGLAGRAKIEKEFDRQIVVEKYMEELQRI